MTHKNTSKTVDIEKISFEKFRKQVNNLTQKTEK